MSTAFPVNTGCAKYSATSLPPFTRLTSRTLGRVGVMPGSRLSFCIPTIGAEFLADAGEFVAFKVAGSAAPNPADTPVAAPI